MDRVQAFRRERLSAFVATLGYSRTTYIGYVSDERIETLIAYHVHAFEFFGDVPHEAPLAQASVDEQESFVDFLESVSAPSRRPAKAAPAYFSPS
jgi:transposase